MNDDAVFKAIADPTRREILTSLAVHPLPVQAVAARFSISRPAVSKHLRVLSDAGLVRANRTGKENVYELCQEPLDQVIEWLSRFWSGRLQTLKALAERKQ